jgi:hypothetical protein
MIVLIELYIVLRRKRWFFLNDVYDGTNSNGIDAKRK